MTSSDRHTSFGATQTIGEIVAADYRTAAVFSRFGLDFCCGGRRTVAEAARSKGIDAEAVVAALDAVAAASAPASADTDRRAADLIDHIVRAHHTYVREALPRIGAYLARLVEAHGERHPELQRIADHFADVARELLMHMYKEEQVLFPYVRALDEVEGHGGEPPLNCFGTVANPIRMMELEHANAGNELEVIRALTDGFLAPADGCATYAVCFKELEAFDADLRRHIHLENNVLFPKAVALEAAAFAPQAAMGRLGCR